MRVDARTYVKLLELRAVLLRHVRLTRGTRVKPRRGTTLDPLFSVGYVARERKKPEKNIDAADLVFHSH